MTKAFEKWLKEVKFPHLNGKLGGVQYDYCEDAWRAALMWAKANCVTIESLPYGDGQTDTEQVIPVHILDEELCDD